MSNVVRMREAQDYDALFEEFWKVYPRHIDKQLARQKYEAIINGGLTTKAKDRDSGSFVSLTHKATPEEILEGARRYRKRHTDHQTYRLKDEDFIRHPTTWLNRGGWLDE